MKNASNFHRLRKYSRRVAAMFRRHPGRSVQLEWLLTLKWRYWHKVHGPHQRLWRNAA